MCFLLSVIKAGRKELLLFFLLVYEVSVCCEHMQMSSVCVALWQGLMSKSAKLHRPVAPLPYKCHLFPASDLHNAKLLSRNGPISDGERKDHSWCSKPLTAAFARNNCD